MSHEEIEMVKVNGVYQPKKTIMRRRLVKKKELVNIGSFKSRYGKVNIQLEKDVAEGLELGLSALGFLARKFLK